MLIAPGCFECEIQIAELEPHGSAEAAAQALGLKLPPQLARAVPTRRLEFLAGRLCAQRALQLAGCAGAPEVPIDEHRAPVWPPGYVGSIAHGSGTAWAVVASRAHYGALGIDLEKVVTPATALELSASVLRPEERVLARTTGLGYEQFLSLVFSAKECLYKCLNPITRVSFNFQDAEVVDLNLSAGLLRVALRRDLSSGFRAGDLFDVRFELGAEIHASAGIPAGTEPECGRSPKT
jgi:enterobactin synthetase component D